MLGPLRVLIVDDRPAMRFGLRAILSSDPEAIYVVGECDAIPCALERLSAIHPDVVLLDASTTGCNPLTAAASLRRRLPSVKILFLLDHHHLGPTDAVPLEGDAYLVDHTPAEKLIDAVLAVARGQRLLDSECAQSILDHYESAAREIVRERLGLSEQEVELLRELAAGASNKEIAAKMYLSEITVIRKVQQVVAKLAVANKTQAVAEAVKMAII